jgi:hypothetical protein
LKFWAGLGLLGLSAVIVWKLAFPTYTHRYRLTIEIQDGDQVRSGSGVIEVANQSHGPLEGLVYGTHDATVSGRAPLIDLGSRGVLLATMGPYRPTEPDTLTGMKPFYASDLAIAAFYGSRAVARRVLVPVNPNAKIDGVPAWQAIAQEIGTRDLPTEYAPEFVWLSDPSDRSTAVPMTVSRVPEFLGAAVRIKRMEIEITSEKFSDEIFKKLPWLAEAWNHERRTGIGSKAGAYKLRTIELLGWW